MTALLWYILVQIIAFCTFQYLFKMFKTSHDRAYGISKVLGLVFIAYATWVVNKYRIASFSTSNVLIIALVYCFGGILLSIKQKDAVRSFALERKRYLITIELIFGAAFVFFLLVAASGEYEKWGGRNMDVSYLWALYKTDFLPPQDPWLSNTPLMYSYFGHFLIICISKLTNLPPNITYILSMGLLPALFATVCFSLLFEITGRLRYSLLGIVIVCLAGNNFLLRQLTLQGPLIPENILLLTGRIIPNINSEYLFSSFAMAEVQSHTVSLVICVTFLYVLYKIFKDETLRQVSHRDIAIIILLGFLLSVLFFTNAWDFPFYLAFMLLIFFVDLCFQIFTSMRERIHRNYVPPFIELRCTFNLVIIVILISLFAFVLFLPFSKYSALGYYYVELSSVSSTSILHLLVLFGVYFFVILAYAAGSLIPSDQRSHHQKSAFYLVVVLAALALIAVFNFLHIITTTKIILVMITALPLLGFKRMIMKSDKRLWFCCWSMTFALLVVLGCEVITLRSPWISLPEEFRNLAIENYHLHALILMGLTISFLIMSIVDNLKSHKLSLPFLTVFFALLGMHVIYPIVGAVQKAEYFQSAPSLKCDDYIAAASPGTFKAIEWINANLTTQVVILEGVGEQFSKSGMISSFTGNPTVVQWPKYNLDRGYPEEVIQRRLIDVDTIYRAEDFESILPLINQYNIRYIFLGELEKSRYSEAAIAKFKKHCRLAYNLDGVEIYQIPYWVPTSM